MKSRAQTPGTTNITLTQDNNRRTNNRWLGLLGLAGLAGLRRHTPVVLADRTTSRT